MLLTLLPCVGSGRDGRRLGVAAFDGGSEREPIIQLHARSSAAVARPPVAQTPPIWRKRQPSYSSGSPGRPDGEPVGRPRAGPLSGTLCATVARRDDLGPHGVLRPHPTAKPRIWCQDLPSRTGFCSGCRWPRERRRAGRLFPRLPRALGVGQRRQDVLRLPASRDEFVERDIGQARYLRRGGRWVKPHGLCDSPNRGDLVAAVMTT